MRFAVLTVVVARGCGPSVAEIRTAHDATYAMDASHLMQVAMDVANDMVGIGDVDLANRTFVTKSFLTSDRMAHRGWPAKCARGGWRAHVSEIGGGRSLVEITPIAQAATTICRVRWDAAWTDPTWVDVAPDTVGLRPTLEEGASRLAVAIDQAARE
jgi:hypothetical protein